MPSGIALKGLTGNTSPVHSATKWSLPAQQADGSWKPGAWVAARAGQKIEYRRNGIHVCGCDQLPYWRGHLKGREMDVYVCEFRGAVSIGPHGFAAREVRLLRPWDGVEEV